MVNQNYYNAYTKVTPLQKYSIVNFLHDNLEGDSVSKETIAEAIEYAVKDRPSFGGFILTMNDDDKLLGAVIVNDTGLELNTKSRIVYMAIEEKHRNNGIASKLVKRAIELTNGNLSLTLNPDNIQIEKLKNLGFQPKYVELTLAK
jgi:GNAT superfamily N-acetyltransferase